MVDCLQSVGRKANPLLHTAEVCVQRAVERLWGVGCPQGHGDRAWLELTTHCAWPKTVRSGGLGSPGGGGGVGAVPVQRPGPAGNALLRTDFGCAQQGVVCPLEV